MRIADDICFWTKAGYFYAKAAQATAIALAARYGFLLAPKKIIGPLPMIKFGGIIFRLESGELALPPSKRDKYLRLFSEMAVAERWGIKLMEKACGILLWISLIYPGVRRFYQIWTKKRVRFDRATRAAPSLATRGARASQANLWQCKLLEIILQTAPRTSAAFVSNVIDPEVAPDLVVFVDGSGSWGWGAFCPTSGRYSCDAWTEEEHLSHFVSKAKSSGFFEAQAVVYALTTLATSAKNVLIKTDSATLVKAFNGATGGWGTSPKLSAAVLSLHVTAAILNCSVSLVHVPRQQNVLADLLSKSNGRTLFVQHSSVQNRLPRPLWTPPVGVYHRVANCSPQIPWRRRAEETQWPAISQQSDTSADSQSDSDLQ